MYYTNNKLYNLLIRSKYLIYKKKASSISDFNYNQLNASLYEITTTRRSRGDRLLRARVNALLCAGKVNASWQVEGVSLSGSNYPITWRPTICWKVGETDRGSARCGNGSGSGGGGGGGGSRSRTKRPAWSKADWTKSSVNALFRANESVREPLLLSSNMERWEAQVRPRAIPVLPSPHARVRQVDHHL